MQMIDSRKRQLKPDAILAIAMKNTNIDMPFRTGYLAYVAEVASKGAKFYQYGNTTYITHDAGNRRCYFTVRNADTAQNFVQNNAKFLTQVYKDGYDFAVAQSEDPKIDAIAKASVRKMTNKDKALVIRRDKNSAHTYLIIVKCGTERKGP